MITNKTITIYSKGKNWKGKPSTKLIGSYDVYLEEHSTRETFKVDYNLSAGPLSISSESKGFFIMNSEVDLKSKYVVYDGGTFVIDNWDRYYDSYGNFHHIEAEFK